MNAARLPEAGRGAKGKVPINIDEASFGDSTDADTDSPSQMTLYKYLGPDRLDVLRLRQIRLTQPADFNDPFEFRPVIGEIASDKFAKDLVADKFESIVDAQISKYGALLEHLPIARSDIKPALLSLKANFPKLLSALSPDIVRQLSPMIDEFMNREVGILCLSDVRDCILMWGHYSGNHRGLVVGFDSEHSFFQARRSEHDEFGFLRKVSYVPVRPKVTLTSTASPDWFQTKALQWEYEHEWRLVRVLSDASKRIERKPFPICLFEFPSDAVVEVIAGMRMTSLEIEELQRVANGFPRAVVFRAHDHPTDYSLVIHRL